MAYAKSRKSDGLIGSNVDHLKAIRAPSKKVKYGKATTHIDLFDKKISYNVKFSNTKTEAYLPKFQTGGGVAFLE